MHAALADLAKKKHPPVPRQRSDDENMALAAYKAGGGRPEGIEGFLADYRKQKKR